MNYERKTVNGYGFYECASALQKAVRRNDCRTAGFFALELWHSGFVDYVWKRLFTISAEDCADIITKEIYSLWVGYQIVNKGKTDPCGRIFISKAVVILCTNPKSRDADHLSNLVYDRKDADIEKWIADVRKSPIAIPEYTYDVHTRIGKARGATKKQFFIDEFNALQPRQKGLFDGYFDNVDENDLFMK